METETAEDSKLGEMHLQRNKMLVPNTETISTFDSMLNQMKEGLMKLTDENAETEEKSTITVSNNANLRLCCFVTCIGVKIKGVTEEHIVKKVLYKNFDMGKRSRWFDEYGQEPNVKVLARIIADLRVRYQGFKGMSQWALELLAHYCVTKYDEQGNISAMS